MIKEIFWHKEEMLKTYKQATFSSFVGETEFYL